MTADEEITIEELNEALGALAYDIPETEEILRIKSEIADRRKKVASVAYKSEAWHQHRSDALEYCCALIRGTNGLPAPINYAFTPELAEFTGAFTDLLDDRWEAKANPLKLANAAQQHWQIAGRMGSISDQLSVSDPALHKELQDYLTEPDFQPAKRGRGRQLKGAARNILIAIMIESLQALGWNVHQNDATEIDNSALGIINEAYRTVFANESRNAQIKPKRMTQIWRDYQAHKKRGITYLGTSLKDRAKGAADLISHDW